MRHAFSVYLVEDYPALQASLCSAFRELGAAIAGVADDAPQAIGEILACHPDVIVLDICLKSSSGFDVLRGIGHPDASLARGVRMMFTNMTDEYYKAKAAELGATHHFDKMQGSRLLLAAIRDCIAMRPHASRTVPFARVHRHAGG